MWILWLPLCVLMIHTIYLVLMQVLVRQVELGIMAIHYALTKVKKFQMYLQLYLFFLFLIYYSHNTATILQKKK